MCDLEWQIPVFRFFSYERPAAEDQVAADLSSSLNQSARLQYSGSSSGTSQGSADQQRSLPPEGNDPLYFDGTIGDSIPATCFSVPSWLDSSFYSRQPDRPFRIDRFMPCCKMTSVQTFGLVEHENAAISIPRLARDTPEMLESGLDDRSHRRIAREHFDAAVCGGAFSTGDPAQRVFKTTEESAEINQKARRRPFFDAQLRPSSISSQDVTRSTSARDGSRSRSPARAMSSLTIAEGQPALNERTSSPDSAVRRPLASASHSPFTPALISRIAAQAKAPVANPTSGKAGWSNFNFFRSPVTRSVSTTSTATPDGPRVLHKSEQAEADTFHPASVVATTPSPTQSARTASSLRASDLSRLATRPFSPANEQAPQLVGVIRSAVPSATPSSTASVVEENDTSSFAQSTSVLAPIRPKHRLNPANPGKKSPCRLVSESALEKKS